MAKECLRKPFIQPLYSLRTIKRMRYLYTSVLVCLLCHTAIGQQLFNPAPGSYALDSRDAAAQGQNREVIWEEDFATGFNGWTSFAAGGVAAVHRPPR